MTAAEARERTALADPVSAAVRRLRSPAVIAGSTSCPPGLADALAELLVSYSPRRKDEAAERSAREVLRWLS